ncbi:hypothetical protein JMM81_13295 [Bacillus sp. V3B]|uniref:DUF6744 family protein n=1 Tax=Bacillus sp. V3B TaxID=2804915 RepID=UPI0021094619|nr:DUF6744 family protein [Bacillus sp. V3B]MCQ6275921.1 hypothetical protein [Bacillus sp. V3B]
MTSVMDGLKQQNIVASKQGGENKLGDLFWYSIGNQLISREDLKRKFDDANMDHKWLPNPIRISDAFRRATGEIQKKQKRVPTNDPTTFLNFLIREVYYDHKRVQRNIVIEKVDKKGKSLEYNSTATIIEFNKDDGTISITTNGSRDEGEQKAKSLAYESKELFNTYSKNYDAQTLRIMVKNILDSMSPTAVRPSGGVYFVPRNHQDSLDAVVDLVNRLDSSEAFSVPLFDTKSNRGMVNKKIRDDMISAISKCKSIVHFSGLRKSQVTDTLNEARRVVKTFNEYQSVVNLDFELLSDSLVELKNLSIAVIQKTK